MSVPRTLRFGVIGLGGAAAMTMPSLLAHPHVEVAAGADPRPEARTRFAAEIGGSTYPDAAALCADDAIDAVYVATPHQCHADDASVAAEHGKHVLVEKPMALTLADCDRMIEAAARNGVVLVVGPTHAFDPAITAMRTVIESGEIGPLRMLTNVAYTDFLYRPRRPEELDTALGGGILYNQVPHQIDIARALAGTQLRSVRAVTGAWDADRPTEGAMMAMLEFADGVAASLIYSGYDRFDSDEFHFWIGELGEARSPSRPGATRAALAQGEAVLKAKSGFAGSGVFRSAGQWHQPHFGLLLASCERGDMRPTADGIRIYSDRGTREIVLAKPRAFPNRDAVIDEFYDAVVHGRPARHDGHWGKTTLATVLALMRSARERCEIVVAP
jgi:phthalate 4,5-cis-dihydrodiol dehydrogenase